MIALAFTLHNHIEEYFLKETGKKKELTSNRILKRICNAVRRVYSMHTDTVRVFFFSMYICKYVNPQFRRHWLIFRANGETIFVRMVR